VSEEARTFDARPTQGGASAEIARLERLVQGDPAAPGFAALAEAYRRAGRAEKAEEVARAGLERRPDAVDGRVALGLALLDRGQADEARAELERVLDEVPDHPRAEAALAGEGETGALPSAFADGQTPELFDAIGDPEIDDALDRATSEPASPLTPDSVAAAALEEAGWDAGAVDPEEAGDATEAESESEIPVATHTVADLLERQGDADRAQSLRSGLARAEHERIVATLERWLDNLRRGSS